MADKKSEPSALEMIKSYARGVLKGNTADTLGAPVDLINELIVRPVATMLGSGDRVSEKPVGGGKYFREKFGQNVEDANPAETVGSMISAGGAAKTAIILPAFLTKSIKEIKRAERYIEAGADMKKVEENLGVFKLPGNIDDGVMRTVLDDSSAKLKFRPTEDSALPGLRARHGVDSQSPSMMIGLPVSEIAKLPQILDHQALFTAVPDLANVRIVQGFGQYKGASYYPDEDVIKMGADSRPEDYMQTLLHEVQHAIQTRYGMNEGGSPNSFFNDPKAVQEAKKHIAAKDKGLMDLYNTTNDPELSSIIMQRQAKVAEQQKLLKQADSNALEKYTNIAGEVEAQAVEKMRAEGPGKKLGITYYGQDVNKLIQYPEMTFMEDDRPEVKKILDQALNEAARTNKKAP